MDSDLFYLCCHSHQFHWFCHKCQQIEGNYSFQYYRKYSFFCLFCLDNYYHFIPFTTIYPFDKIMHSILNKVQMPTLMTPRTK
jgi:hypothetical protein